MKAIVDFFLSRNNSDNNLTSFIILFFRLFSGLLMIPYGYGKIVNYDRYAADFFGDPIGIGDIPSLWLTIFAQIVCPITLILGSQTRLSALILAFNMLIAVKFHFFDPFSVKVLPILFFGMYLVQIMLGAGRYSIDHFLYSTKKVKALTSAEKTGLCCLTLAYGLAWFVFANTFSGLLSLLLLAVIVLLCGMSFGYLRK